MRHFNVFLSMIFFDSTKNSTNLRLASIDGYSITIKREDLIHPIVSGNKFRKLKYNFKAYQQEENTVVLTFGGAFSNHLAATAHAGKMHHIPTIGIVRGEEWEAKVERSTTLDFCRSQGMKLFFTPREAYREKQNGNVVLKLKDQFKHLSILPEGGTNALAIKGCKEILSKQDSQYDAICCCVGTGGTLAGIVESSNTNQRVLGFNALQNVAVKNTISQFTQKRNWELFSEYTFGGYAKVNRELIHFMNDFYKQFHIPLDPIYTGKMLFGIFDLIKRKKWKWGNNILVIHSGGLQGINPMNLQLQKKGLPTLTYAKKLPY